MSKGEEIKDVIREINRSQITGPFGQSKEVRFYSENNGKPLKILRKRLDCSMTGLKTRRLVRGRLFQSHGER